MSEIPKHFDSAEVEARWLSAWLGAGCFRGGPVEGRTPYTIVIPPPNVTGVLTMGHVLNNTLQDVLIRRARLEGRAACWVPGTDHAGIATQTRVERELRKEGLRRQDLGRERFLERVRAWREMHGGIIIEQLKRLGCSCDWERNTFTMDPDYSRAVLTAFVELFRRGLIYRGKRLVNWCPASLTALSDEEVILKPRRGSLYTVRYEVVDQPGRFLTVSTTRPETIPGDVAVAVHPEDPRYADLVGRRVWRPLCREAIPVIADTHVDRSFGTGALKITPAHDRADWEIGRRHSLPAIDVLEPDGTLNRLAGPELAGLDRFEARTRAAEILRAAGLLEREEPYENMVGHSERADVPIEPRLTEQWWLRYPCVEEAREVVRSGLIRFHPERWTKVYLNWLDNIQDWCISRQLWWGHRIPVWYRKGADRNDPATWHVSVDGPSDPDVWEQEEDVLDTWASSWLWPFATLGWPDETGMRRRHFDALYPTSTLVTGPDIIFFWVARMIMAGLALTRPGEPAERRIPFRDVYFTGIIRDAQGRKMSKSLGNSPDPLDLIAAHGADGLRFGLLQIAPLGQDIRFDESRVQAGRNFCTKLWNAARFRQMQGAEGEVASTAAILTRIDPARLDANDHFILGRLLGALRGLEKAFAEFDFAEATQRLYTFFWNDFCDWYVEVSKGKVADPATRQTTLAIQDLVLRHFLLLFHPFAPFVTEELWHRLGFGPESSFLQDARLPIADSLEADLAGVGLWPDAALASRVGRLQEFASIVRQLKAAQHAASRKDVRLLVVAGDAEWMVLSAESGNILRLIGAAALERSAVEPPLPAAVTPLGTVFLETGNVADPQAERARLKRELEKLAQHIAATEARLDNPAFTGKAPPAVIDGARKQLADLRARRVEISKLLAAL